MRRFHRILAMILAIVTAWTVIPMSVFADTWMEIETENETSGDVSSVNITLSVDPEALISYIKNGDKAGLLEGISLSGLRDAFDKDELIALFSETELGNIADIVREDLDLETLLQYIDVDALLKGADMDALIAQVKALPDLQDYVLDYDKLMAYLDEDDLIGALDYVDTEALIHAHVDELAELTLELDAKTLADLVDIAKVVDLEDVDFFEVLNLYFIENDIGYDTLFDDYVDEEAMLDYLHARFDDLKHELHYYLKETELDAFLAVHGAEIVPYLDLEKLQTMLADEITDYSDVEVFLKKPALYGLVRNLSYSSIDSYVSETLAKKLVIDDELIDPKKLVSYINVGESSVDMDALMDSSLITDDVISALFDGGAIDLAGNVNTALAKNIIIDQDLIAAEDLLPYINLYETEIDMDALMADDTVVTDAVRDALINGGAIDSQNNVDYALAKQIILDESLIEHEALLPFFVLGDSAIDMTGLMASDLITADIYHALEDGGAVVLDDCIDLAAAKQIILDEELIDLEELVEYVDLDTCVLDMTGLMTDTTLMTDDVYDALVEGGAVDVKGMVSSDDPLFDLSTLHRKGAIDVAKMIAGEYEIFDVWELEDVEIIDFETVLAGDPDKGLSGLNPDWLVKDFKVFDLREMLSTTIEHDALFTVEELAAEDIVLLEDLAHTYGYDNIVDVAELKDQIRALPDKSVLIDCILDPAQVIRTVGVMNALDATGESYSTLIDTYVTDQEAFFNALGVTDLLSEIAENGELEEIFDLQALIKAIGLGKLLEIIDLRATIRQLIDSGALKEIVTLLDSDTYLSALTYTMGVLEKNVYEIKINDVVISQKDGTLLFIDTALFIDTVLDELLPPLDDIVNMGDDGLVFSAGLSVTYASEDTDGVKKTKEITVNAVLASGVDRVRAAATRTKSLLEKFLTYEFNDGILTLDLRLPSKFASALRVALEKLSTSGDPALEELKNEILDLYDANVNDVSAFLDSLTLEQVAALLNMVDASKFSAAYAKVMTNQYVETLLAYIKEATGQDFTDLTPEDLLIKAGELPTVESLCDKIEARLGREIEQLDRLPEGDPVEILERLASRAGIDADLKKILEDAAKTEDPLATLYEDAVARIEDSGDAYEVIQGRVVGVLDRLLASRFGEKLSALHLNDLYDGEGVFKYAKSVTVDPMEYVRRVAEKGIELLDERTSLPADTVDRVVDLFMSYFKKGTELTLGVDATLRAEDIYRIEFYEMVDDRLVEIRTAFLPAGTELATVQPYETDDLHTFLGWKNPATGEIYQTMPEGDVQVVAELDDNIYHVYFYAWDDGSLLPNTVAVNAGDTLDGYLARMNEIVRTYLDQQIPDRNIKWKNYPSDTEFTAWETPIEGDIALTWEHFYDVALVNPADGLVKQTMTVPAGTVLATSAYFDVMNDTVRSVLGNFTLPDTNIKWLITGTAQEYQTDSKILEDLSLTWDVSYQIKVMAPTGNTTLQTLTIPHGDSLADHLATINDIARRKLDLSAEQLPDANIEWYDWNDAEKKSFDSDRMDAVVTADGAISWKYFFDVTVLNPDTDATVDTLRVPGGDKLGLHLSALNQIVKDALADTHPDLADGNIVWFDAEENKVDFENATVNGSVSLTWKLGFTVDLVWGTSQEPYKTFQLVDGERLWEYLDQMNYELRNLLDSQAITNDNIDWYNDNDPAKTVLDEAALKKNVVSDLTLSCNCYFSFKVLDEKGDPMAGLSFRIPFGNALSQAQIDEVQGDVLKYINETLGLDYILAEDVTFKEGDGVFNAWNSVLGRNITLTWTYAEYYQVEVYAPDALGGELVHTLNVLGGHKISEDDYATIRTKIYTEYYSDRPDLPISDIILIKMTGENFGVPVINEDVSITWRLAEYYDVEILYQNEETGAWESEVFVAREGNIFYISWSEYARILALRDEIAGPAPEDYEYIWLVVDENGNVTEEQFPVQTAITKDLRLTWSLRYNAVRYSISIVDPADPETVLWSADGLKNQTHVVTYLSEQKYGDTEQSVWEWLQALVAAADPHLEDYVHEYRFSWRSRNAGGFSSVIALEQYKLESDLVLTWNYTKTYDNAALGVVGAKPYTGDPEVDDYAILQDEDDTWVIRFKDHWFEDRPTEFMMTAGFLKNAIEAGHGIRFDATASKQEIVLSDALLAKLYAVAKVQGVDLTNVTLRYSPEEGKSVFDFAGGATDVSGSAYFTLDFYVNGSENGQVLKLGDFNVANDPENGVYADVLITLPFANLVANGNGVKTFVCFEEEGENGKRYAKYELVSYDLDAMTVSFYAPHFSSVAISNQYKISTAMPHLIESGIPADLLGKLPTNEDIAFYPIDLGTDEYYSAGAQIPIRAIVGKDDHLSKIDITRTLVLDYDGKQIGFLPASGTYTMPAQPIELCFEIAPKIYRVYYYVDGALMRELTQAYTAYMIETPEEAEALKKALLSLEPLGEEYTEADGWSWNGFDDRLLGTADMYLSLVRTTTEESVGEKTVDVIYYGEDGVTVLSRVTYKVSALVDLAALPTVESILGPDTDATRVAYWVNLADGSRVPADYTADAWQALLNAGKPISLRVAYVYRSFVIYTDGNVKVTAGENEVGTAQSGTELTVSLAKTIEGKTPNVLVKTASGETVVKSVGEGSVSFVMPAEDVIISVTYTAADTEFTGPEGDVQIGTQGELKSLPPIVINRGMSIDMTKVPKELILADAVTEGETLVLTYQYVVTKDTDAKVLLDALLAAIKPIEYRDLFIINSVIFENAEDALAYIQKDADFKDWSDTVDKNLHFGSFEQATEEFPWIVILILAILLLLILLIVLFYVLYVKGILKPNVFLKVITAIVSVFFAVCMALARAWLAVLRLFGVDEERLVRRYPLLKKRRRQATLDESLEALKEADPSYDQRASEVAESRIASKTATVVEELEITDDPETDDSETDDSKED